MSANPQQALILPPRIPAYARPMSGNSSTWNAYTMRQLFSSTIIGASGSLIQLTLQSSDAQGGFTIDSLYVGHAAVAGDPYDFDGTQVRVTYNGSNTISAPVARQILTDPIAYALDETKDFIVAAHFTAASYLAAATVAGATCYYKAPVSEAGDTNVSSYANVASIVFLTRAIEVIE